VAISSNQNIRRLLRSARNDKSSFSHNLLIAGLFVIDAAKMRVIGRSDRSDKKCHFVTSVGTKEEANAPADYVQAKL
jgi:hypothetical protein